MSVAYSLVSHRRTYAASAATFIPLPLPRDRVRCKLRPMTAAFHRRLVEAPAGADEIIRRGVAADAFDDHRRRQQLEEVDERLHVLVAAPSVALRRAATWSASGVSFTQ